MRVCSVQECACQFVSLLPYVQHARATAVPLEHVRPFFVYALPSPVEPGWLHQAGCVSQASHSINPGVLRLCACARGAWLKME
jgi:hypothetical protein